MNNVKTAEQCRGHHRKMLLQYGSLKGILTKLPIRNNELRKVKDKQNSKNLQISNNSVIIKK